jgi:KDO2-lipid IV(A) lauroyltransferase
MTEKDEPAPEAAAYKRPVDLDQKWRATAAAKFGWSAEAFLWDWAFWNPMKALPIEKASSTAAAILRRVGPLTTTHRTMLRNLRMAFPNWSEAQIKEVSGGAWENLGRLGGEMPHLDKLQPYTAHNRTEVVGVERLDALREQKKPAVFICGHFANWEIAASALVHRIPDVYLTYRAANNPLIDKRVNDARTGFGAEHLAPKGAGTRDLMRALGKGKVVFLMNDQKFNQGIPVPFFGYDAMTAPGPTRLAMRFKCPLMPMSCKRTGVARYRVTFHEPIWPENGPDEAASVAATVGKINKWVETTILEAPDQWFWMHNRWPKEAWVKAGVM